MKKWYFLVFLSLFLVIVALSGYDQVFAKPNPFNQDLVGEVADTLPAEYVRGENNNPVEMINRIIQLALSFLGIGTMIIALYAGYLWMTAAGIQSRVDDAKKILRNAVIGLILILSAYSLTYFVAVKMQQATGSHGRNGTQIRL